MVLDLVPIIFAIALAILGAIIGAWLQHRNWHRQRSEELREERTQRALSVAENIARLVDRRLYRQRRLLWALQRGDLDEIAVARQDYKDAVFEWMDNLGRIKAELWSSFDQHTATSFERQVHDKFAKIGREIEAAIRSSADNKLVQEEKKLNVLGYSSYRFVHSLLERISDENINGLSGKDSISFDNWNNLSSLVLLKRLFGLPS